jgi:hypothetical protein
MKKLFSVLVGLVVLCTMTSRRQFIHETLGEDPGEGRHDPYRSWKIAAANASAQREHLKRLHAELDRLRSLNANLRPQV